MGIIVGGKGGQQHLSWQAMKVLIKESFGLREREREREREVWEPLLGTTTAIGDGQSWSNSG